MPKGSKISGLFFIVILLFLNLRSEDSGVPASDIQNGRHNDSASIFSSGNTDIFFLNHHEERGSFSLKNLPLPCFAKHINHPDCELYPVEKRIFSEISGYLSYAIRVEPGLANVEIIYPFHCFW